MRTQTPSFSHAPPLSPRYRGVLKGLGMPESRRPTPPSPPRFEISILAVRKTRATRPIGRLRMLSSSSQAVPFVAATSAIPDRELVHLLFYHRDERVSASAVFGNFC